MAVNDFDRVAPVYDALAKLVFGSDLLKAQKSYLDKIQPEHNVLVLGGGTGQTIPYMPRCKRLDFLDKSSKMIAKAKKRKHNQENINFLCDDFMPYRFSHNYDIIIVPFFLDCFGKKELSEALKKTRSLIKDNGELLVYDFSKRYTPKLLSYSMHAFFKSISFLESSTLKDIHTEIVQHGFEPHEERTFRKKSIFSNSYTPTLEV